jgi:hypothetical protein
LAERPKNNKLEGRNTLRDPGSQVASIGSKRVTSFIELLDYGDQKLTLSYDTCGPFATDVTQTSRASNYGEILEEILEKLKNVSWYFF